MASLDWRLLWETGLTWEEFFLPGMAQRTLWDGVYQHVRLPEWALVRGTQASPLRLLVITEDWCGDAANSIPVLQRLVEATPSAALRILKRDEHLPVMDQYLTGTSRSIPIVIGLSADWRERGHWGPRPTELQAWVMANLQLPKDQRYAQARRWYAKDHGETTLREVFGAIGA